MRICIEYCHKHISEIISAPCNMNCISGQILTEIAQLFTLPEIEVIRDRKDKFKSKLFAKKVSCFVIEFSISCSRYNFLLALHLIPNAFSHGEEISLFLTYIISLGGISAGKQ